MTKKNKKLLISGLIFITAFAIWTLLVQCIDVKAIGPDETSVGFATLNAYVHDVTGVNMALYTITDWLGILPICVAFGFAALGFIQLIKRRSIFKVDKTILALGIFYIAIITVYILFEAVIINYRPILIEGCKEASYPSSTTMLVMCVMPTALMQLRTRIQNEIIKKFVTITITAFTAFMVIVRILSGVHWITDIIGGALISAGLVLSYSAIIYDQESFNIY